MVSIRSGPIRKSGRRAAPQQLWPPRSVADFGLIGVDGGDSPQVGFVNSERVCVYGCLAGFCQFVMYGRSVEELFPCSFYDNMDLWHETVQDAQPQDSRHK